MLHKIKQRLFSLYSSSINPVFFLSEIIIPLCFLSFYLVIASLFLPIGINKTFVSRASSFFIPITLALFVAYIWIFGVKRLRNHSISMHNEPLNLSNITLILFPLTPVIQYVISNHQILFLLDAIVIFLLFALTITVATVLIPYLLGKITPFYATSSWGLALSFLILEMPTLSKQYSWHDVGSIKIQLPLMVGIWFVIRVLAKRETQRLLSTVILIYFLSNTFSYIFIQSSSKPTTELYLENHQLFSLIDHQEPHTKPNIYLLVYDAYVPSETLLSYGIDNQPQEQYLLEHDFKIYPNTYSIGATSLSTMSRVLNVSSEYSGAERNGVSGNGLVHNLLNEIGYQTYGVFYSDYFFRGINPSYDFSFPGPTRSSATLIGATLEGEFRFDFDASQVTRQEFLQEKTAVLSKASSYPKFVYVHSSFPGHSQNSGVCQANEVQLYNDRLQEANREIRVDIKTILDNDPNALLIVAGDHGPYLTKNCIETGAKDSYDITEISRFDIQDRFGTFLAIRWPSENYEQYDDITVLQDLFPSIFSYLYDDLRILQSKVEPISTDKFIISGAKIDNGIIIGGLNDGESLFIEEPN